LLPFSISYLAQLITIGNHTSINDLGIWDAVLIGFSLMAIGLVISSSAIQSKHVLYNSPMYSLGAPIASFIISLGFISSIIDAKSGIVKWKGRKYAIGNTTQHPLH
jgi:hypothetical protein